MKEELEDIVRRFYKNELLPGERKALLEWVEASKEHERSFREALRVEIRLNLAGQWECATRCEEEIWQSIRRHARRRKRWLLYGGISAAAMVALVAGIRLLWQGQEQPEAYRLTPVAQVMQAEPGVPQALLKTSGGKTIALAAGETRRVAILAGVDVVQDSTGGVRFAKPDTLGMAVEMNTVYVPERGEYQVELSDGTRIWVNSASEISFPSYFAGNVREVTLAGEAYFEVARDSRRPFYVNIGNARVQVLGTAFNVSAYRDERTTEVALLNGKVRFDATDGKHVLSPGEIAALDKAQGITEVREGDVASIIAWKEGRFYFEDMRMEDLALKLSRWYGVDFAFDSEDARELRFSGGMVKYRPLNYVLEMISKTTRVVFQERAGKVYVSVP